MKDIAEKTGYSISTVSHVVNGTRFVERETKKRILDAVEELHYVPNLAAQSLRGKSTRTIGVILTDIREGFFAEVVKAIETTAGANGYSVILCDSEDRADREDYYVEMLIQKGVDGFILTPADTNQLFEKLRVTEIPSVQIDRKLEDFPADFIGIDNFKSSERMTELFLSEGRKKIGYVGYSRTLYTNEQRMNGYIHAMNKHGLESFELVIQMDRKNQSKQLIEKWLYDNRDLEAVICANDILCYDFFRAAIDLQLQIPEQCSVASYDDVRWFSILNAPVTTIVQPTLKIGEKATQLIINRIQGEKEAGYKDYIFDVDIIKRG
ncbi:MAG: LacI family transcriptional regulator [Spirochaetales bacterium]|nr:LacI family transcriptional regulator [Spirochaetales bacterium]